LKKVAVLGSGKGTNLLAILKRAKEKKWNANFVAISDRKNSGFVEKALKAGLRVKTLPSTRRDEILFEFLNEFSPDLIVLAGYMRILPSFIVSAFEKKILNLHPSLLPAFKGAHAIRDAFDYGVKWTGITVHIVTKELDDGPIIAQQPVQIYDNDNLESLEERIHTIEHEMYPKIIEKALNFDVRRSDE
jgi:phosphoribosylglycinamide formyltransferase-1